jgi:hypothetical protein
MNVCTRVINISSLQEIEAEENANIDKEIARLLEIVRKDSEEAQALAEAKQQVCTEEDFQSLIITHSFSLYLKGTCS